MIAKHLCRGIELPPPGQRLIRKRTQTGVRSCKELIMTKIHLAALSFVTLSVLGSNQALALNAQPMPPGATRFDNVRINRGVVRLNVRGPRVLPPNPCRRAAAARCR
jgi:hypothetical protein